MPGANFYTWITPTQVYATVSTLMDTEGKSEAHPEECESVAAARHNLKAELEKLMDAQEVIVKLR
jgi:hypothetical protein